MESKYWACDNVVSYGPYDSEEEAYDAFLAEENHEPQTIIEGKETEFGIEGIVIWP